MGRVLLIRHGKVDDAYRGLCYGGSDIGLSREGEEQSLRCAEVLRAEPITTVIHSGMRRAAFMAEAIAEYHGLTPEVDRDWREIHFGVWELQPWEALHDGTNDGLTRLLVDPDFAPENGESLNCLRARVLSAWERVVCRDGLTIVVAHGGPLAIVRGRLSGRPAEEWVNLIPRHAEIIPADI